MQKKKKWGKKREYPLKSVKVKGMLLYASLNDVPCNRRLLRLSNPGQLHDIRKISGGFLQVFLSCVDLLSMI